MGQREFDVHVEPTFIRDSKRREAKSGGLQDPKSRSSSSRG
jgi:hypothetical protein